MPFWRKGNRPARLPGLPRLCSGCTLKPALLSLCLTIMVAVAVVAGPLRGEASQKPTPKTAATRKSNELTLAGLRPGKDTTARLYRLYPNFKTSATTQDGQISWDDPCRQERLTIDVDSGKNVQVIRVARMEESKSAHCDAASVPSRWKTGLGLRVLDNARSVIQLYGQPDSRSPSTKDGQPLE